MVRLGYHEDETSEFAHWHVPQSHFLESWGDTRTADGTYCAIQPMILPLFGGYSDLEIINLLLGHEKDDKPDLGARDVRGDRQQDGGVRRNLAWNAFLRDGFLPGTAAKEVETASFNVGAATGYIKEAHADDAFPAALGADDMEVVLINDYKVDDGRYANNGWLQEMPHPITKMTWDNAVLMSPATARKLGVNKAAFDPYHNGVFREGDYAASDMVEIEIPGGRKIKGPVLISPGHADGSVSIALGYGRRRTGRVGRNTGFDAYPLRTDKTTYFATGAKVTPLAGETYQLVITQHHQVMEGRNLARELPIETYKKKAGFGYEGNRSYVAMMGMDAHIPPNVSLYRNPPLDSQHQWGMAIDLNTCTGCNACVVACQAENNIPVVGKDQVSKGRAMHWIRIDRYYSTVENMDPAHPEYDPTLADDPQILDAARHLPPLRERALRDGLPGQRDDPHGGGAERDGLQPLHRHALLLQQLPVQGAPVQLLQLQRPQHRTHRERSVEGQVRGVPWPVRSEERGRADPQAFQEPERHRADARRHGKMHVLRAAHRGSQDRPVAGGARFGQHDGAARLVHDGLRAGLPGRGDCFRQRGRPRKQGIQGQGTGPRLQDAGVSQRAPAPELSGSPAQPEHGDARRGSGRQDAPGHPGERSRPGHPPGSRSRRNAQGRRGPQNLRNLHRRKTLPSFMATATPITAGHSPEPPPPASINPQAAAVLADLRTPLVSHERSLGWLSEHICNICEEKTPLWWWIAFVPSVILMVICFSCFGYLILTGVGVWGENSRSPGRGTSRISCSGSASATPGTLISAILFLTRQRWRTAVNRAAEAMTLFAVMCAGLYPGLHVGRVWMAWFLAPVPNQYAIWPNFRSPLLWDVFAVSTYFTVSVLFWYTGLIPDLATLRDRAQRRGQLIAARAYGFFALGWRNGNRQWRHYEMAYLLLAALSTPLVLSVHTIVSFDFAT